STITPVADPAPPEPKDDPGKLLPPPPKRKPISSIDGTNRLDGPTKPPSKPRRPGEKEPPKRPDGWSPAPPLPPDEKKPAGPPVKEALGPDHDREAPLLRAQAMQKLVEVLSVARIDERALEKAVDSMTYRIVVANPAFARIRGIDLRLGETRELL